MTEEEFERFLKWLDEDREVAAQKYEQLRRKLTAYFIKRQCANAEELADKVLDAIARQLAKQNSLLLCNPLPYIFGIARNVHRRHFDSKISDNNDIDWDRLVGQSYDEDHQRKELRNRCLEDCLQSLKGADRQLFLLYYLNEIERPTLAARFGLTINALRLKMMRLRDQLRLCITSCQQNSGA